MTGSISTTQGYTCGLWSLLHFFTVASGQQQQQQQQSSGVTGTSSSNTTAPLFTTTTTAINTVDVLVVIRALVDQVNDDDTGHGHDGRDSDDSGVVLQ